MIAWMEFALVPLPIYAAQASKFGAMPDGEVVNEYRLTNQRGSRASVTTLGATLRALEVKDRDGQLTDVVLGYDTVREYLADRAYFGATIGRYANRIANAQFTLDGKTYHLSPNDGAGTLHGGIKGFNRVVWRANDGGGGSMNSVRLKYVSPDGEEGYPGKLTIWVTYTLTDDDELKIRYRAIASATTVVNFTNHSYFNLGGAGSGEVLAQRLQVDADAFTPMNGDKIPTGEIAAVAGTDYDFQAPSELGSHLATASSPQVTASHSFDMNLLLREHGSRLHYAATLQDPRTGIEMQLATTEPAVQLYTPRFPVGFLHGKNAKPYQGYAAVCLEPQHFPDSPHHPQFPSTVLRRGEVYTSESVYRFRTVQ